MERKNKLVLFLLIVLVMTVALISSFGLNIFAGKGAEIVLPTPDTTASGEDEGLEGGGQVLPVRTTPETVQNIISTLTRPENYARTVTVEMTTGASQAGSFTANVLVDGAWTSIELTQSFQPMGTQYTIVYTNPESGEGTLYRWYAGSTEVKSWPVGESGADLAQHIPTYEDVLELDQESIVDANYVTRDGVVKRFAQAVPASRVLVNTPSALGGIGATTCLFPALTLGCGAVGGSSSSNNIGPLDLINIKRVAWGVKELEELRGGAAAAPWQSAGRPAVDDALLRELVDQIVRRLT